MCDQSSALARSGYAQGTVVLRPVEREFILASTGSEVVPKRQIVCLLEHQICWKKGAEHTPQNRLCKRVLVVAARTDSSRHMETIVRR